MANVELLYFPDCPNIAAAREQLRRGFAVLGQAPSWSEHDVTAANAPAHVRGHGSPTIIVDGVDIAGAAPTGGASCRIYPGSENLGVPPLGAIVAALRAASTRSSDPNAFQGGFWPGLAVIPGVLLSALPVVGCPSCWPAYAGVLSALGVPLLMDATWLLPLTATALLFALGGIAFQAKRRRGFGPLVLGVAATTAILVGKFVIEHDVAVYGGTVLLIGASVWNSWPRGTPPACDACL